MLSGKFRNPATSLFRLDAEGERRLTAFLSGASSSGSEASFESVGQTIKRYSELFGEFSGQRPPIAIYVGAARPLPNSCSEWKKMTTGIATTVSGKPRVFGLVFANVSAGELEQQLGMANRGPPETLGLRTRALTCNGEAGSALLFVPFLNLTSRNPGTVLGPAFDVVERWLAQPN